MKNKNKLCTIKNAIPGGEGLIALPTAFVYDNVIASAAGTRQSQVAYKYEIDSLSLDPERAQGVTPLRGYLTFARNDII
jgi:hypothetical protein